MNHLRLGFFEENPALHICDFALKDRLGQWTYQFAVVIDDMEENIGMIVRGEDLRNSTARQILLMSLLGKTTPPLYFHHSLLYDPQTGLKLSKRQQSQSLRAERMNAIAPEEILGRLCFKQHLIKNKCSISFNDAFLCFRSKLKDISTKKVYLQAFQIDFFFTNILIKLECFQIPYQNRLLNFLDNSVFHLH